MRATGQLVLLLLLPALAGCANPPGPAEPGAQFNPATDPVLFEVFNMNGTTGVGNAGNSIHIGSNSTPPIETAGFEFNTTRNATAVLFELTWEDPLQDLDAYLSADVDHCDWDNDLVYEELCHTSRLIGYDTSFQFGRFSNSAGTPGKGDSPSRVLADGGELAEVLEVCNDPCHWKAYAWAKTVAVEVSWSAYVTVFYGPVPEGYTALPQARESPAGN